MLMDIFHYEWKRKRDKVDSQDRRDYTDAEIDASINEAILQFCQTRYSGNNPKQTGFEVTQQRIDDLSTLVIKSPMKQPLLTAHKVDLDEGIYEYQLSDLTYPYMHYLRARAKVTGCATPIDVIITQHDDLNFVLRNEQLKPSVKWNRVIGTFGRSDDAQSNSLFLYTNKEFELDGLYIDYLKMPDEVSIGGYNDINGSLKSRVECDLPGRVHNQIIDLAVKLASGVDENIVMSQLASQELISNE